VSPGASQRDVTCRRNCGRRQFVRIADALSARSGVAVLKNPSDTGHEDELLAGFPDAQIIISRRRAAGITASSYRAMDRYITTSAYGGALRGDDFWIRLLAKGLRNRLLASLVRFGTRWGLRARLTGYLRTFSRLPADRVARGLRVAHRGTVPGPRRPVRSQRLTAMPPTTQTDSGSTVGSPAPGRQAGNSTMPGGRRSRPSRSRSTSALVRTLCRGVPLTTSVSW
jgi:hypothetical protein